MTEVIEIKLKKSPIGKLFELQEELSKILIDFDDPYEYAHLVTARDLMFSVYDKAVESMHNG